MISYLLIILFFPFFFNLSEQLATMSVDLGNEFMKVAIVKPGVPMEIALDPESQRKTPTIVAIKNGDRYFGQAGLNMAVKFPKSSFQFVPMLLGKDIDHPIVLQLKKDFNFLNFVTDEKSGQLCFLLESGDKFSIEEAMAMLLETAKETAEKNSGYPIKGAVLTVPPFFNQAERRALLRAARLINLKVLQLINDNSAVALNYGVFRYKTFNQTAQYFIFYDMGATKTTASLVEYRTTKVRDSGYQEEVPQLTVLGLGYDASLGVTQIALRVRNYLAAHFDQQHSKSVAANQRALSKLFREAIRVIRVLSANSETTAQVENVMDERDLKLRITREEFEGMCADLISRVAEPLNKALEQAQLPLTAIEEVILMGGGTRIPFVQESIRKSTGLKDLGKGLNSDEAAALGAVYQAAFLTPGFRVKKFLMRDLLLRSVQAVFNRTSENPLPAESGSLEVTKTVFSQQSNLPQRKALTFNKNNEDFQFQMQLESLKFPTHESNNQFLSDSAEPLIHVKVSGVAAAFKKHMQVAEKSSSVESEVPEDKNSNQTVVGVANNQSSPSVIKVEPRGVKAHFEIDASGLLNVRYVEALFEKSPAALEMEIRQREADKSTLTKIGETLSNFFSGSDSPDNSTKDTSEQTKESANHTAEPSNPLNSNKTSNSSSEAKSVDTKSKIISETLPFEIEYLDWKEPSDKWIADSVALIARLKAADEVKKALEKSRNDLEAFIFENTDKLEQETFQKCATEAERSHLSGVLNAARDWYDEQGADTGKKDFDDKLASLSSAFREIDVRIGELSKRPQAFARLKDALNQTQFFLDTIKNFTNVSSPLSSGLNIFSPTEIDVFEKLILNTRTWQDVKQKEAQSMDLTVRPSFFVDEVDVKTVELHREMQYLISKINLWKSNPPPPPPPPSSSSQNFSVPPEDFQYGNATVFNTTDSTGPTSDSKPPEARVDL